ncbi:MAG: DNA alkylation repair protein [Cyanobacteria bacterium J06639_18]
MEVKRKGARRIIDIPPDILEQINRGEIETANLTECLALDFAKLMSYVLPNISDDVYGTRIEDAIAQMKAASELGWMNRTRLASKLIYGCFGASIIDRLLAHTSDNVRGWASGVVALIPNLSIEERLNLIKPLADDPNSGTRETVWLLMRERIADNIEASIQALIPWTASDRENVRRFATESTRPRGVWCSHIPKLKESPNLGLPLLEPLKSDSARYVQNSVANWLNDAAKSQPDWVVNLTKRWLDESNTKETHYIVKRGKRSL